MSNISIHRTVKKLRFYRLLISNVRGIMFRETFIFLLLSFTCLACFANESVCTKLAGKAEASGITYHPSAEAKVIGDGKVNFYSAPNAKCRMKGVFVVKNNYLTVYTLYKGWVHVMYVAKDGEDLIGWLQESKVKIVGQYGQPLIHHSSGMLNGVP